MVILCCGEDGDAGNCFGDGVVVYMSYQYVSW